MANFTVSEIITHLTTAQNLDNARLAGDRRKLPPTLRTDVDDDLAGLQAAEQATSPAEGGRAGASGARRAALDQLEREHHGGYRGIAAIDEATITAAQRLQVFVSYDWASGEIGEFNDDRIISLARLAPTISAAEVGNAAWLYSAARLGRIAAQLAIVDAMTAQASGADAQTATLARDAARKLAATTLLRVRFFYCCATRDADQTPDLVAIGYQPRREPGEGGGGGNGGGGGGPTVPAQAQITSVDGDGTATVTLHFSAAGATSYDVYIKEPATSDFTLVAAGIAETEYTITPVAGAPWFAKVVGKNAEGDGPESAEVNFSGPV